MAGQAGVRGGPTSWGLMPVSIIVSLSYALLVGRTPDAASCRSARSTRAGDIGPIRKEITFEPLREIPAPADPPRPNPPERPAEEPVPAAP